MTTPADAATSARRRGLVSWWYLIFLGNLAFQPAFDPEVTAVDVGAAVALAVIGVVLCVVGERSPGHRRLTTVAFAVCGATTVWINAGATVFHIYAAADAAKSGSRTHAHRWMLGLTAILLLQALTSPIPMPYRLLSFGFPLLLVWLIGLVVLDDAHQVREAALLRVDNARIERLATLSERERIARDLHDLLGHTLTGILVRAQLIRRLVDSDPARAAREAGEIETIARDALSEVRTTVSGWRHHALDTELDAARSALAAADVTLRVEQEGQLSLSPTVEAALALTVREAVTNVVRHAAAGRCTIGIVATGGQVRLTVADDGVGASAPDGSGLTGMRERITALGGRVERRAGHGTTLHVTVPAQGVPA